MPVIPNLFKIRPRQPLFQVYGWKDESRFTIKPISSSTSDHTLPFVIYLHTGFPVANTSHNIKGMYRYQICNFKTKTEKKSTGIIIMSNSNLFCKVSGDGWVRTRNMLRHCTTNKLSYAQWNVSELFSIWLCLTWKSKLIHNLKHYGRPIHPFTPNFTVH
jgi:hypothetical protein